MLLFRKLWNDALAQAWFPPVMAGIVFHLPVLFCAFVYDDVALVAGHPRLAAGSSLAEIWQRDYGLEFAGEHRGFYRPAFMTLVFALRNLFGPHPFAFHLFSLAIFCLAIALVVRVASAFDVHRAGILPLAAGVLYAVHPARVETVSLAMSLPDLIVECCALGMILALVQEAGFRGVSAAARASRAVDAAADTAVAPPIRVTPIWRTAALCGALALLAALAKESSFFVVPAVMGTTFLFALLPGAPERKRLLFAAGAGFAALAFGFLLRNMAHVQAPIPLTATAKDLLAGNRAADTLLALLLAARDVVLPGPVVFWRNVAGTHLPGAAVALALLGAAVACGWLLALRRGNLPLALLVAWCGANAANLAILIGSGYVYSHRYLAFAPLAILLCLAVRAAVGWAARRRPNGALPPQHMRAAVLVVAMYATALGAFTLAGSAVCLTQMSFFRAMQRANPADVVPAGAVAETLNKEGSAEEVEECVRFATALDPTHPQVPRLHNMLIQRYLAEQRYNDALRCAQWSLGIYANDADKMALHAVALANLGQTNAARQEVERVLARHPDHAAARQLLEQLVRRKGEGIGH